VRAAKVDANHAAVVSALRAAGASVESLAGVGKGVPDLLIGVPGTKRLALFEVKDGSKPKSAQKLTPAQELWHSKWSGYPVCLVDGPEAALRMLRVMQA
jgi:hypothetical protein